MEPLAALVSAGERLDRVVIHTLNNNTKPPRNLFAQSFAQQFDGRLPAGPAISIQRWTKRLGGEDFHDRFVLTEIGGIKYGQGLDVGPTGTMVHPQLLERRDWAAQLRKFTPETSPYEAEQPIIFQERQ